MYYIIEHQKRKDGVVNTSEIGRSTYELGASYYYERMSKMVVNQEFESVSLMFVDEKLNVFMKETLVLKKDEPVEEALADK